MPEQTIEIAFDAPGGDPDAAVFVRKFYAFMQVLRSVDERSWNVGQPRYRWQIVAASKASPFTMEVRGVLANPGHTPSDSAGRMAEGLTRLGNGADESVIRDRIFDKRDLKRIEIFSKRSKQAEVTMTVRIQSNGKRWEVQPTPQLAKNAAHVRKHYMPPADEEVRYEFAQGVLHTITADFSEQMFECKFELVTDEQRFVCSFNPADAGTIGAHVGHRIFVEGHTRYSSNRHAPARMAVEAFRLVPKEPLSLEQIRAIGLRVPGGMTSQEYVRSLRADSD